MRDEKSLTDCIMSISETVRRGFFLLLETLFCTQEKVFLWQLGKLYLDKATAKCAE